MKKVIAAAILFVLGSASFPACSNVEDDVTETSDAITYTWAGWLNMYSHESVVAPRGPGRLDLFRISYPAPFLTHWVAYSRYTDQTGWLPQVSLGQPGGDPRSLAVVNNGGRLDLFAAATNGRIYHTVSDTNEPPTWVVPWYEVPGARVKNPGSGDAITVSSRTPGVLDLFWVTPLGNIGHKWTANNVWAGTETGDEGVWFLQPAAGGAYSPPIESESMQSDSVDIVLKANYGSGGLNHHYYTTTGGWGRQHVPCCKRGNGSNFTFNDFVMMKSPSSNWAFEVFAKDGNVLQQLLWIGGLGWAPLANGVLTANSSTQTFSGGGAVRLNDGLLWNATRRDIFGWQGGAEYIFDGVWQMYF